MNRNRTVAIYQRTAPDRCTPPIAYLEPLVDVPWWWSKIMRHNYRTMRTKGRSPRAARAAIIAAATDSFPEAPAFKTWPRHPEVWR